MPSWQEALQSALDYIEENLTGEIDVHDVAARAYVSAYHFQRVFSATFGMPLGEYVRCRRLTLAAQELAQGTKVIDMAVKYGYDSPDSFARAFRRFHDVLPSQAGLPGVMLRSLMPMKIEEATEVRQMMEYRIETKEPFTVVGYARHFHNETSRPRRCTRRTGRKGACPAPAFRPTMRGSPDRWSRCESVAHSPRR